MTKQREKLILDYIKRNVEKRNIDIADLIIEQQRLSVTQNTMRLEVGKIRRKYNLEKKEVIVSILDDNSKKTGLEVRKDDYLKTKIEFDKLKSNNQNLYHENKILIDEISLLQSKISLIDTLENSQRTEYDIKAISNDHSSESTAFWIGSDWHIEETVDPLTVNGMNEYNLDIAKDSIQRFFKNALKLTDICKRDTNINHVVLGLLGDHITGYIHDELIEDNSLSPTQASMVVLDLIASGIKYALENSNYTFTVICKDGNHGRTTQKKRISTEYKNSYEWMMFNILSREFKNNERIKFIVEKSYLTYLNVYDKLIRFHHGDYIKYQGGVGGLTIPANKAISQWDKERMAYLDVFGHYHQLMLDTGSTSKFVMNGSIIGYNAYAVSIKASYEQPKQAFFLIDKHRGKTFSAPIFVR